MSCWKLLSRKPTKQHKCFKNHVLWVLDWVLCLELMHWLQNVETNDQESIGDFWKWFEIWQPNWLCGLDNNRKTFFSRPNIKIAILSFNWPEHDYCNALFCCHFRVFSWIVNPALLTLHWLPFGQLLLKVSRPRCRMLELYTVNGFWYSYLVCTFWPDFHVCIALKVVPSFYCKVPVGLSKSSK